MLKQMMMAGVLCAMMTTGVRAEVSTGAAAPDFTLLDVNGATNKLSDFKGKVVVLEWINHGCPFVVKHYAKGNMQGLQADYTGKGVVWLSICSSAEGKQGYYATSDWKKLNAEKGGKATAILLDPEGSVGKLYGAKTTPHMFVINAEGTLVYQGAIDEKPSTEPDDIPGAKNFVASALDEVLAGQPVTTGQTKPYGCSVKYK